MIDILIPNQHEFDVKLQRIIAWWPEHFHVIADFDRTLTKAFAEGKPTVSLITRLQNGFFPPEYADRSNALFHTYHPIEIDPNISAEEKNKAMHKWRDKQFNLMLEYGLTREIIKQAMASEDGTLRPGNEEFFNILHQKNIPLIIISASGLGYESVYYGLEHENKLYDNIDIISNAFIRDENGKAIGVREPIIHSFNKHETIIKDFPVYEDIKERKNILLIWDSLGDAKMANGFDYENILKIWFLNHDTPEHREKYSEAFDMLILDDGPMDEVNKILKKILK